MTGATKDVMNGFKWELYDLNKDWTQSKDLASQMPDKLRDLQQTFTMEAAKYNVFPLDDSRVSRFMGEKPNYAPGRTVFTYSGELSNVPFPGSAGAPDLLDRSYTITADIEIPQGGAEGVLVTDGGRFGGYGFYLLKGKPVFTWNLIQLEMVKWQGKDALAPGKHSVEFAGSMMVPDWARAVPAHSSWTVKPWTVTQWRTVLAVAYRGPRRLPWALIPALRSTRKTIKCHSRLLASLTS